MNTPGVDPRASGHLSLATTASPVKPFADVPDLDEDGYVNFKPNDVQDPRNWSLARKWYVTTCALLLALNGNYASSIPSGCTTSIAHEFHVSEVVASLTISLYLLGFCAGPLFFAPLSEFYGRRWIFYLTTVAYIAFNFLCAFPVNLAMLLIGRLFTGICSSAALCNSPGLLADIWAPVERGNPMAAFSAMMWIGPALGPIVAGFLDMTLGWRWSFYTILLLGGASLPFVLSIPETHNPTVLIQKAKRLRKLKNSKALKAPSEASDVSLVGIFKTALTRPWALLFDPISFLCAVYMSIVYTLQYMLFTIYPIVFQDMRGWNQGVGQLPLLGTAAGALLGAAIIVLDTRRRHKKFERGEQLEPEDRLLLAMGGGVGFPVAMFWFAWTGQYNAVPWIVVVLGGTFLATCLMLIFFAYSNYILDTYHDSAASATAVNTVTRSAGSAAAPLFTTFMFDALGVGGGGSLIGGVAVLLAVIPFVFYRYGKEIRNKSKYTPKDTYPETDLEQEDEERGLPDLARAEESLE